MQRTPTWILAFLCLLLAGGGAFFALSSIDALYVYRSPLRDNPPAPGQPLGQGTARQVVFVLIDGLRYDTSLDETLMPNLAGLRKAGASARMTSQAPSFSQPGYSVLLTGAEPDTSDGPAVNLDPAEIWTFTQDNLFSAASRAGLKTAISGYFWFEKLVPQDAVDLAFYTPGEDRQADRDVVDAALPWLRAASANLVLVHIDQVDYAGHHEGGPLDPRWGEAAARADALLGEILAAVDLNQDAVLVVSDHGHILKGGHGGHDADVLEEPFVLAGAGVRPGDIPHVRMVDVAPTVAALLGSNLPASAWGQPLDAMLALDETRLRDLRMAERAQKDQLEAVYREAIGGGDETAGLYELRADRKMAERWPRLALVGVGCLLLLAWAIWKRPADLGRLAAGAGLAVALFYLYYTGVEGRALSLSAVTGQGQILGSTAVGAVLGLAGGGFLAGWRTGRLREPRFWLAFGLAAGGLSALPGLWSYLLDGLGPFWTLPDIGSAFTGLLSGLQAAYTGLGGLLLAGLASLLKGVTPQA